MKDHYLLLMLLAVVAISLGSCKKSYTEKEDMKTETDKRVKIVKLESSYEPLPIMASGVLASETQISLSFKVGGILRELKVAKGATVGKGQSLARLDLLEINAQVLQAKNSLDKAERDLKRTENLYKDTVATLEQFQNSRTAFELAKAAHAIAEFNQQYAQIRSPINGKVLQRKAEEGELVSPGQPIYLIGSTGDKGAQIMKIGVADKEIIKLKLQDKATITFDVFPGRKFNARISEMAEEASPLTGTFDIELTLNEYHDELRNGFVGYVSITPSEGEAHYKIPMAAMIEGDGKSAVVFTLADERTVQKRQLAVQEIRGDYFTVSSDQLDQKEWLVLDGGAYLSDKDSVKVIN